MISPIVINVNKPTRVVTKSLSSSPCCFNVFIMLLVYEKVRVIVKLIGSFILWILWFLGAVVCLRGSGLRGVYSCVIINSIMANLKYGDLAKRSNNIKFIDKVFARKGNDNGQNENNWNSDDGLFLSESVIIAGKEYKKYDDRLPMILISADKNPGIFLKGHFSGKPGKQKINMTKLFKSDEFGGQGPKGNQGHEFERQLDSRLQECLYSRCCNGRYDKEAKHLIEILSKHAKSPVKSAVLDAGANTSRPIKVSSGKPYIEPNSAMKHGELLTDITVHHKNTHESYLSLKTSATITFINSGVQKEYFLANDMKKGRVSTSQGIALLEAFGLDNELFCSVFNQYGSGRQFPSMEIKPDKSKLTNFMRTAIGANYHMVHELNGQVYYWWVGDKENKKYADISNAKMTAYYGGKSGKGKRIDVEFENQYYKFGMNIRNKQSGVYPSHIMLDYTSKPAVGKTVL